MTEPLAPHRVVAFNIAAASENKIHDDTVAARFGFAGGLVPGVAVFGYMAHLPVARWGRAWLERGSADCRFVEPVYDGREAVAQGRTEADGEITIEVVSDGRLCATGRAALPGDAGGRHDEAAAVAPLDRSAPHERSAPPGQSGPHDGPHDLLPPADAGGETPAPPPAARRPPADERSLAVGTRLAIEPFVLDPDESAQWLDDLRETETLYRRERLAHPATLLRVANWVLTQNVVLGPWIHVGSRLRNHAAMPLGAVLTARARVTGNDVRKGHRFVELAIDVLVDGRRLAARIEHTAIYRPRQVAEAGATAR